MAGPSRYNGSLAATRLAVVAPWVEAVQGPGRRRALSTSGERL